MYQSFSIWVALTNIPDPMYAPVIQKLKIKSEHFPGLQAIVDEIEDWEY